MSDSLPQRMCEAAKVLREADGRLNPGYHSTEYAWTPKQLESAAVSLKKRIQAEKERAVAEREAMVEGLARRLDELRFGREIELLNLYNPPTCLSMAEARKLIADGWTKQAQS